MRNFYKLCAIIVLMFFLISLIPILILGRYNHPTGDDYHYGVETGHIWASTHDLPATLAEAAKGVSTQYQIWQGTYSAMFLMYLPPNIFGAGAYHWVTAVMLCLLSGGIFYFIRQLLCCLLKCSVHTWLIVSSLAAFLCIQTTDFQSESFFWYNGSMYYTGFFSVSLFFLGGICKWITRPEKKSFLWFYPAALFLAGGNYVSFLPALILAISITIFLLIKKRTKEGLILLSTCFFMLAGFAVSALAPGNRIRQSGMWKISPILAVAKAIRQGFLLLWGWKSLWILIALLVSTPFLWSEYRKITFRFPYPLLVVGYGFGIFCSMSCPTFYTMNSIGPARAIAIIYYAYVLFIFFSYIYLFGFLYQKFSQKKELTFPNNQHLFKYLFYTSILLLFLCQIGSGKIARLTALRALSCLTSGEAAAYEEEYQERLQRLADPEEKTIIFSPYRHPADLLYVGDLTDDPSHPTNARVAEYFEKDAISVHYD